MADHTGGDGVVDALEQARVEVVFGIPSVHNLPLYDALRRRGRIRAITVRHEQAAAGCGGRLQQGDGAPRRVHQLDGPGGGQLHGRSAGGVRLRLAGAAPHGTDRDEVPRCRARFHPRGAGSARHVEVALQDRAAARFRRRHRPHRGGGHRPGAVGSDGARLCGAADRLAVRLGRPGRPARRRTLSGNDAAGP